MSFLCFEDDELDIMFKVVNKLQMFFHPTHAPMGQFSVEQLLELRSLDKDIIIIADNNLVSPICEIVTNGLLKNEERLRKVALFITWSKYINARVTCGMGLIENDSAGFSNKDGEEQRLKFLHGVDNVPATIWKDIAFGYRDSIPDIFLYKKTPNKSKKYDFNEDFLYLSDELAIAKVAELIRTSGLTPIDKFIGFMNWYTDNLDIAESVMLYAAMVFAGVKNVSLPKRVNSKSFTEVQRGIKNQAWDISYITTWSMFYYKEKDSVTNCTMFATDDITQKIIVVNIIPPGQCYDSINEIFNTKAQREKLRQLYETRFGEARVRPFNNMTEDDKLMIVKDLLNKEYEVLRKMCDCD